MTRRAQIAWFQVLGEAFAAAGGSARAYEESDEPADRSVWVVQKRLQALGLWPDGAPLDGRPSETTRAALRRFQKLSGLRADGDVHDPRTRLLLRDRVRPLRGG